MERTDKTELKLDIMRIAAGLHSSMVVNQADGAKNPEGAIDTAKKIYAWITNNEDVV
jgi:hypothetical protein